MKLLATISILAVVLLLVGCTASKEKAAPEQTTAGEAAAEPTAEQMESDLDTAFLDEVESDLDSMILE